MVKRRNSKKKKLWTTKEEELLIEVWNSKILKLRGLRRNRPILEELIDELAKLHCNISVMEAKNKIHNLTTRYVKEKSVFKETGTPPTWSLYPKVHRVLGRFHTSDKNLIEEIFDSDDECSNENEIAKTSQASSTKSSGFHAKTNNNSKPDGIVICRSCVKECTNFKSLYNIGLIRGEETTLATLLTYCTNLKFSYHESTSLPRFMCTNCILELTKSYIFIKKVREADKLLRDQLSTNHSMEDDEMQQEQSNAKDNDESILNNSEIKSELPQVECEDMSNENAYKEAEDYMEYILQDEMESIVTKEETKLQESDVIEIKSEIEESDISKIYSDLQPEKQYDVENNMNPLDITPNTELDTDVVDLLVIKKPNDIHLIICKICSKQFSNKNAFGYHMQTTHSDNTPHNCNVSGKTFKTICAFEGHPNMCGKSFRPASSLNSSLKILSVKTEAFICHICGKQFGGNCSYKIHMLRHNGEKRSRKKSFSCGICGIAFYTYKKMWSHRNNHGELKKFKCGKCFQRFFKAEELQRHVLGHKKKVFFNCQICSQAFKRETSLHIHLRFHEETIITS